MEYRENKEGEEMKKNVTFKLSEETIEQLKELCQFYEQEMERHGLIGSSSQAAVVESLIKDAIERLPRTSNTKA